MEDDKTLREALDLVNKVSEFKAYLDPLNQGDKRVRFLLSKELFRLVYAGREAEVLFKKISGWSE